MDMEWTGQWVNNVKDLPKEPGIYIVCSQQDMDTALYVGQSNNIKARLTPSHHIYKQIIQEYDEVFVYWESVPDKQSRINREHSLIGKLEPEFNDGNAIPVVIAKENKQKKIEPEIVDPNWQNITEDFISRLRETAPSSSVDPVKVDVYTVGKNAVYNYYVNMTTEVLSFYWEQSEKESYNIFQLFFDFSPDGLAEWTVGTITNRKKIDQVIYDFCHSPSDFLDKSNLSIDKAPITHLFFAGRSSGLSLPSLVSQSVKITRTIVDALISLNPEEFNFSKNTTFSKKMEKCYLLYFNHSLFPVEFFGGNKKRKFKGTYASYIKDVNKDSPPVGEYEEVTSAANFIFLAMARESYCGTNMFSIPDSLMDKWLNKIVLNQLFVEKIEKFEDCCIGIEFKKAWEKYGVIDDMINYENVEWVAPFRIPFYDAYVAMIEAFYNWCISENKTPQINVLTLQNIERYHQGKYPDPLIRIG